MSLPFDRQVTVTHRLGPVLHYDRVNRWYHRHVMSSSLWLTWSSCRWSWWARAGSLRTAPPPSCSPSPWASSRPSIGRRGGHCDMSTRWHDFWVWQVLRKSWLKNHIKMLNKRGNRLLLSPAGVWRKLKWCVNNVPQLVKNISIFYIFMSKVSFMNLFIIPFYTFI